MSLEVYCVMWAPYTYRASLDTLCTYNNIMCLKPFGLGLSVDGHCLDIMQNR